MTTTDGPRATTRSTAPQRRLFFFHGLESGPHGSKYRSLAETFAVESPDFQGMDIDERLERAIALTEGLEDIVVVGSSFGGLLATLLHDRHPERFHGVVLLAPALHLEVATRIRRMPPEGRLHVIHGIDDDIVPLDAVVRFCAAHGHAVTVVEDDHRLGASHPRMIACVRDLLRA